MGAAPVRVEALGGPRKGSLSEESEDDVHVPAARTAAVNAVTIAPGRLSRPRKLEARYPTRGESSILARRFARDSA
jgi:hypothetical protein